MADARLTLSRMQVLAFRRRVSALDQRLPAGAASLRRAAWAGLQDSMPRAALLSLHARVAGIQPGALAQPGLVQLWGPRFHAYAVAAADLAVFSLGRLPQGAAGRKRALDTADRLHAVLDGRRLPFGEAGRALGVNPNSLRYAAASGRVLLHWSGAGQPEIWTVDAPVEEAGWARLQLARRYLHRFGPTTAAAFAGWAGVSAAQARAAWKALSGELLPVRTPAGDAWVLASDEAALRQPALPAAAARLLPSGDTYFLLWGADRALLLPDETQRASLWTTRVWPGALLVDGEIAGVWRRAAALLTVQPWRRLSKAQQQAVEAEAQALPLPGIAGTLSLRWE